MSFLRRESAIHQFVGSHAESINSSCFAAQNNGPEGNGPEGAGPEGAGAEGASFAQARTGAELEQEGQEGDGGEG